MTRQSPIPVYHSPLHSQRARFTGIFPKRYSESTLTRGISSHFTERETESHWDQEAHTKAYQTSEPEIKLPVHNSVLIPPSCFLFHTQFVSEPRSWPAAFWRADLAHLPHQTAQDLQAFKFLSAQEWQTSLYSLKHIGRCKSFVTGTLPI